MVVRPSRPAVGRVAFALGFAGLIPQVAVVGLIWTDPHGGYDIPFGIAYLYPSLIISFLGGIWWGFAMRRDAGQAGLAVLAVLPSLAPLALLPMALTSWRWPLVLLGIALFATLAVDRRLTRTGEAPANWMVLRVPLSVGLGALTIVAGLLAS